MRTATTAVVAGLVVLASALAGGALAADRHGASTGAAAPLQADNGTSEADDGANASALPPGVNASGVENATALVAAHRRGLAETGYRYVLVQNASFEESPFNVSGLPAGGFTTDSTERGTVEAGLAPFHARSTGRTTIGSRTANVSTDLWGNETVLAVRTRLANQINTQHVNLTRDGDAFFELTRDDANDSVTKAAVVELTLASGSFEVVNASGEFVTLRATGFENGTAPVFDAENVTRYDARVVVDRRGVVHRLSLVVESDTEHLRYGFEVTERGPVEVTRPGWVAAALQPGCETARATANRSVENVTTGNETTGNATTGDATTENATTGNATAETAA